MYKIFFVLLKAVGDEAEIEQLIAKTADSG